MTNYQQHKKNLKVWLHSVNISRHMFSKSHFDTESLAVPHFWWWPSPAPAFYYGSRFCFWLPRELSGVEVLSIILAWPTSWTPAVGGLIVCDWVNEWVSLCVRGHVAILLGAWWKADYETLHVCRVPWCQQCVKFWWWPTDPITFYNDI